MQYASQAAEDHMTESVGETSSEEDQASDGSRSFSHAYLTESMDAGEPDDLGP